MNSLVIRNMSEHELALALDWAAAEGWNPGLDDARCFYAADPNGFFLGELDDRPAGCILPSLTTTLTVSWGSTSSRRTIAGGALAFSSGAPRWPI